MGSVSNAQFRDHSRSQLTTQQIRCFVAVASSLHFGQAANELFLSQPALSRQIVRLETTLGTKLFDRSTRRVALTSEGSEFLPHAQTFIAAIDHAVERLRQIDDTVDELWLSHPPYIGAAVEVMLRALDDHYPDVAVYCVERLEQANSDSVARAQLGIEHDGASTPAAKVVALGVEPMTIVVPAGHRLATRDRIMPWDLGGESIVAFADCYPAGERQAMSDLLHTHGIADIDFQEMPLGPTTLGRLSVPTVLPTVELDDVKDVADLIGIPVTRELCPKLSLWWEPRLGPLMRVVLPEARERLADRSVAR